MSNKPVDLPEGESITTGVVRYKDLCYFLVSIDKLVEENVPFSRIYTLDGGQLGSGDEDWLACSATVCHLPEERFLAMAQRGGYFLRMGGGEQETENLKQCQKGFKRKPGLMREIRCVAGGRAYAVGTGRQAYKREAAGVWKCIDEWSQCDSKDLVDYSFESIDGFAEDDIYTVGWQGEIWHYNGKTWKKIQSPTNLSLHKVKCVGDGRVYIAGKQGLLIRGREEQWDIIEHGRTEEDIWGLEWFDGKLYASTTSFVYSLEGDELSPIDYGECDIPGTCYHLSAADGILWSIGAHDIVQFDGKEWIRVL